MLPTTIEVFKATLRADPTISAIDRGRLLAMIRTGPAPAQKSASAPESVPRILRRAEVARRLSVSLRTVDKLPIQKLKLPGRTRAAGFLESDINALLEQKAA
jgi:predicted DNA-binding transcriptional regulator AlpA